MFLLHSSSAKFCSLSFSIIKPETTLQSDWNKFNFQENHLTNHKKSINTSLVYYVL